MKAFVISVDTPQSRAQAHSLMKSLKNEGVDPELVDGILGKALSTKEMTALATPMCSWMCTPAMIGIGASHIQVWKTVVNRNIDNALVLEDDAHLAPNFGATLRKALEDVPKDYHILLAGCFACSLKMPHHQTYGHGTISDVAMFGGTHAYVVSQQGAQFLLENNPKVGSHIDWQMWTTPGLKVYKLAKDIADQSMDDSATSSQKSFPYILNDLASFPLTKNVPLHYFLNVESSRLGTYKHHIKLAPLHTLFFAAGFAFGTKWPRAYWLGLAGIDVAYGIWLGRSLDPIDISVKCALFGLGAVASTWYHRGL